MKTNTIYAQRVVAMFVMLCCGLPIRAVAQSSRPQPSSAEAAAAIYWERLTVCPVPNKPGETSVFDYDGKNLNEYRSWWKKLFVDTPTEAERLNGMQNKALGVFGYAAYRTYDPSASKWSPFKTGTFDAEYLKTLQNVFNAIYKTAFDGGHADFLMVSLERRNGVWYFERMAGRLKASRVNLGKEYTADSLPTVSLRQGCVTPGSLPC